MNNEDVELFIYCRKCVMERPEDQSISDFARLGMGRTENGLKIWCNRHDELVAYFPVEWQDSPQCQGCP